MEQAPNYEEYAQTMQKMYTDAFAVTEAIKEAAEADRKAAYEELDAARDARKAAEDNGEQIALEHLEKRRKFIIDSTRNEVTGRLILMHLKDNKPVPEIMQWLDVKEEDIEKYQEMILREKKHEQRRHLEYSQDGRGGKLTYIDGDISLDFDWEFAGGNGVAIIFVPEKKYWEAQTGLPLEEREGILEFIGKQTVEDKAPSCVYEIYDGFVEILYHK